MNAETHISTLLGKLGSFRDKDNILRAFRRTAYKRNPIYVSISNMPKEKRALASKLK
jgi:hypothetical protein